MLCGKPGCVLGAWKTAFEVLCIVETCVRFGEFEEHSALWGLERTQRSLYALISSPWHRLFGIREFRARSLSKPNQTQNCPSVAW